MELAVRRFVVVLLAYCRGVTLAGDAKLPIKLSTERGSLPGDEPLQAS